jgi:hypothetical protein
MTCSHSVSLQSLSIQKYLRDCHYNTRLKPQFRKITYIEKRLNS